MATLREIHVSACTSQPRACSSAPILWLAGRDDNDWWALEVEKGLFSFGQREALELLSPLIDGTFKGMRDQAGYMTAAKGYVKKGDFLEMMQDGTREQLKILRTKLEASMQAQGAKLWSEGNSEPLSRLFQRLPMSAKRVLNRLDPNGIILPRLFDSAWIRPLPLPVIEGALKRALRLLKKRQMFCPSKEEEELQSTLSSALPKHGDETIDSLSVWEEAFIMLLRNTVTDSMWTAVEAGVQRLLSSLYDFIAVPLKSLERGEKVVRAGVRSKDTKLQKDMLFCRGTVLDPWQHHDGESVDSKSNEVHGHEIISVIWDQPESKSFGLRPECDKWAMGSRVETVRFSDVHLSDVKVDDDGHEGTARRKRYPKGHALRGRSGKKRRGHVFFDHHLDVPHVLVSWKQNEKDDNVLEYVPVSELVLDRLGEARLTAFASLVTIVMDECVETRAEDVQADVSSRNKRSRKQAPEDARTTELKKKLLGAVFDVIDDDGNGDLSAEEAAAFVQRALRFVADTGVVAMQLSEEVLKLGLTSAVEIPTMLLKATFCMPNGDVTAATVSDAVLQPLRYLVEAILADYPVPASIMKNLVSPDKREDWRTEVNALRKEVRDKIHELKMLGYTQYPRADEPGAARDSEKVATLKTKLQALQLRDLTTRAAANGADEQTLDRLYRLAGPSDEECKKQLIELIVEQKIPVVVPLGRDPKKVAALKTKLQALNLRDLKIRAIEKGADEQTLDRLAGPSDEKWKKHVIELIMEQEKPTQGIGERLFRLLCINGKENETKEATFTCVVLCVVVHDFSSTIIVTTVPRFCTRTSIHGAIPISYYHKGRTYQS